MDPSDLGWKDTFKVNPLEIIFLALRPTVPTPSQIPFELPNSVRLIDPTLPAGALLPAPGPAGWFDPLGNPITPVNHTVNFGWEYVWHCHILSHEEMDFMHSLVFAVPPKAPTGLTATQNGGKNNQWNVQLKWTDNSTVEAGYTIERAPSPAFNTFVTFTKAAVAGSGTQVSYQDNKVKNGSYWYRVRANGAIVGDTTIANFPTMSADSADSNIVSFQGGTTPAPLSPTLLSATLQPGPQVSLTWTDNATTETGFVVERCPAVPTVPPALPGFTCSGAFAQIAAPGPLTGTGAVTYVDTTVIAGNAYSYRVKALNGTVSSLAYTNTASVSVPGVPVAPTGFDVALGAINTLVLNWSHGCGPDLASFTVQRATDARFTKSLNTSTLPGCVLTTTQSVNPKTTYYYRIKANNSTGASSAWTNALTFPIRTP